MPFSQKTAIISLMYKKGEKKTLKKYRPISLPNTDYKSFAHVLANRLQNVAKRLIGR
jgi:hypothetical protein